ncbi:PREDICTED: nucleolar protein 8 isoform X4 [Hipposideros armiger]|uniref:Nucleolar protein 8 isoform X4 n=1 Tax=Hipposideros armiger TaxID=186990 RepID=A0A8B7QC41_HIPAR|nr:PREDICTED: nucleolar protein 8 isoform X4 [Hipposideros armiger]
MWKNGLVSEELRERTLLCREKIIFPTKTRCVCPVFMKTNRETKRLFVGGLGQNISEADLQNQFSRFGEVSDVEIITRKDDQGMSVLNKTKWKGGTLQIQLAKESFLHRLAQERQEAKAKKEKSTIGNTNLLKKMGVVDFHVKAVPGTEVRGHKNWVVSKFGRVLPVLHLKNQRKHKIMKYDPSKYCHNLKKIGEDFTNVIPISNLTWELEGGNDPMSKKRRGEFSDFHSPPKKIIKAQKDEGSTVSLAVRPRSSRVIVESPHMTWQQATQELPNNPIAPQLLHVPDSDNQKVKHAFFQTSGSETTRSKNSMSDDDTDSEDELRLIIAREENRARTVWSLTNEFENDSFEVVRDDFKSDVHKPCSLTGLGIKNNISCLDNVGNDCNYDSGDTDEIIAMKNKAGKVKNSTEFSQMEKPIYKKTSLKNRKNCELSDHCSEVPKKNNVELASSHRVKRLSHKSLSNSSSSEDAESVSESAKSEEDEYNAMMKNCLSVALTLADLGQLAGSDLEAPKEDTESNGWETTTKCDRASKSHRTSGGLHRGQQCIHPEEIVVSLLEGEENTPRKQTQKENNLKPKFQAFMGVSSLYGKKSMKKSLKESVASNNINKNQNSLKLEDPTSVSMEKEFPYANGSSSELTPSQRAKSAKKADDPNHIQPQKKQSTFESQDHTVGSPGSSEKGCRNYISSLLPLKDKKSLSVGAETPFDEDFCHRTTKTGEGSEKRPDLNSHMAPEWSPEVFRRHSRGSETDFPFSRSSSSDVNAEDKHAEDNQKRLAALTARQKAKELQKKLVHDALANLDGHPEDKPTHIIFGSDSESETVETSTWEQSHLGEKPMKESLGRVSGKLFDSSNDEESDSEDDSSRFRIKPQFEGRAGKKLLDLQSHFATDDRFRMDSRFLESDSEEEQEEVNDMMTTEEEALAAEKLKALDVVQSVLCTSRSGPASKGPAAAKKFKDIIHYDPTRHDHATYERKTDDKPKESKAKRKKKREEAEKLPEVSKEMYYNIATDLKEIFQTIKDNNEKEDMPWNEDRGREKAKEVHDPDALVTGAQQPGGFTFSFFDSDPQDVKEETYRIETVKHAKTAWQRAPHFQDSSSEGEDVTEETDDRMPNSEEVSLPEKETTRFFFFCKDDERLHGFDLFWSGMGGNISRNSWEARTNILRVDCRKKHKDAKRKVKPK